MSISTTDASDCSDRCDEDHLQRLLDQEEVVKSLLAKYHGSTKHPEVMDAISLLSSMNPSASATSCRFLEGEFLCHTLPEFPGRIKDSPPNTVQYTLGRLSFNVFQPHNLVCTVRSTRQSIHSRASVKDPTTGQTNPHKFQTFDYPISLDLTIHAPKGDLPAILYHSGVCYQSPKDPQRMDVVFKGSTLLPAQEVLNDPALLQIWKETFHNAYNDSASTTNESSWNQALQWALQWWFQMELPHHVEQDYSVHFQMKRPPRGHLEFLYLSERLRITKGNRGTLVVVERMVEDEESNLPPTAICQ
jgi:PAP_fibrillin